MRDQHVFDPLISKRSQFLLATQLVKMILKVRYIFLFIEIDCDGIDTFSFLKIDDVIQPGEANQQ